MKPVLYDRASDLQRSGDLALLRLRIMGAPLISQQPLSQWAVSGSTVTLQSGAYGLAPLDHQWRFNGMATGRTKQAQP